MNDVAARPLITHIKKFAFFEIQMRKPVNDQITATHDTARP